LLTARGWWFFAVVAAVTLIGVAGVASMAASVPVLGITLLAWFFGEWLVFAARYRSAGPRRVGR
jgi:uncharacterized membrane protein HdeD (DUF308 family)